MSRKKRLKRIPKVQKGKPEMHLYVYPGEFFGISHGICVTAQRKELIDYSGLPPGIYVHFNRQDQKKYVYIAHIYEEMLMNGMFEGVMAEMEAAITDIENDPTL